MGFERLCAVDDLESGSARRFDIGKHRIALVRIDDDFYAIGDRCTHQNISLAEGEVYADVKEIECWKHGSTFSLVTGAAMSLPATKAEPVYQLEIRDGEVWVKL